VANPDVEEFDLALVDTVGALMLIRGGTAAPFEGGVTKNDDELASASSAVGERAEGFATDDEAGFGGGTRLAVTALLRGD
jgi:hypothetical protein